MADGFGWEHSSLLEVFAKVDVQHYCRLTVIGEKINRGCADAAYSTTATEPARGVPNRPGCMTGKAWTTILSSGLLVT